jgi:hypothetical protein
MGSEGTFRDVAKWLRERGRRVGVRKYCTSHSIGLIAHTQVEREVG